MKIAFVVNNIFTEWPDYTTTKLAHTATVMGHDVWYVSVNDFAYDADENIHAFAYKASPEVVESHTAFLEYIRGAESKKQYINIAELDVLMLRNNPADDAHERPWARLAGINFARFAVNQGVLVLNDPDGLSKSINKLYLQQFPKHIRPAALITRDREQIKQFCREQGTIVIKPLLGSGGRNVFLVRQEDAPNMNQMIDAVSRDGYIIAQEYLPEAVHGDVRVFLVNGELLTAGDAVSAFRRVRKGEDMRSNMTVGATTAAYVPTPAVHDIVETVAPILKADGLFFVGLDMVGDKLMEINVFSPGGLISAEKYSQANYSKTIIEKIENKLLYRKQHPDISNHELAALNC